MPKIGDRPFVARWRDAVLSEAGPGHHLTRLLLVGLARYMNADGGECYPSATTIQEATSLSRRAVFQHIKLARVGGWIEVETQPESTRGGARNHYQARLPTSAHHAPVEKSIDSRTSAQGAPVGARTSAHHALVDPATSAQGALPTSAQGAHADQAIEIQKEIQGCTFVPRPKRQNEFVPICRSENETIGPDLRHAILEMWNEIAVPAGCIPVRGHDLQARQMIADLWRADSSLENLDAWREWIDRVIASPKLTGKAPRAHGRKQPTSFRFALADFHEIQAGIFDPQTNGTRANGHRTTNHERGERAIADWLAERGISSPTDGETLDEDGRPVRAEVARGLRRDS